MKGNFISQLFSNFHRSLKGLNTLVFKIVYSVTHPIKGLENLIRLLKNRAFSLVLFFGSGVLIYFATMDFLPVLLQTVYADMSIEAAKSKSMQIALFSEILLGISKIKKLRYTSFLLVLLVMSLSMSGFIIEISNNINSLTKIQLYGQILFGICLNGLPVVSTWIFGNDASKIPMKRRKRKKSEGQNLTNEEREKKRSAVLEAFDSGQFSTLGEMAIYADVQNETVTRILKKERPEKFAEWKTQNNVGRKSVKPKTGIRAIFA